MIPVPKVLGRDPRFFLWAFTILLFAGVAPTRLFAADSYHIAGSSYSGVTYITGLATDDYLNFNCYAYQTFGTPDPSYNANVVVGLYNTATSQVSDPQAIWLNPVASGAVTGDPVTLAFKNGVLNFSVTLLAGCDSEQVTFFDPVNNINATYPGTIGVTTGFGYTVQGYSTTYFPYCTNWGTVPDAYPPGDTLSPNNPVPGQETQGSQAFVPYATSVTGSMSFAVTGVNGYYAAGGVTVSPVFQMCVTSGAPATCFFEVVLDYYNQLTDYDNIPANPASMTVFNYQATGFHTDPTGLSFGSVAVSLLSVSGMTNFPPAFTNGNIVMRMWQNLPTSTMLLHYADVNAGFGPKTYLSYINIPYSPNNVTPLEGQILSPAYALDGSTINLQYAVTNIFSQGVTYFALLIPPNSPATGTQWQINSVSNLSPPYTVGMFNIAAQPVTSPVSAPGTVIFSSSGVPLPSDSAMTFTLNMTCPSQSNPSWQMPLTLALSSTGSNVPSESPQAVIGTLGIPSQSTSFLGAPVSFNTVGGSVSLSWAPVTNEDPFGYVLTRNPGTGAFSSSVTLTDGQIISNAVTFPTSTTSYVDATATNQMAVSYTLAAFNPVTVAPVTGFGPVTAFVNPGAPTALTALTGGPTVQLNWTAPGPVAGSFPLAGYQVFRNGSAVATVTAPTVTYLDTGLSGGVSDTYTVSAFDNVGPAGPVSTAHNGGPSNIDYGYPLDWPPVPSNTVPMVIAAGPTTYLNLTWTAPAKNLNPVNSYIVYRQVGGVGAFNAAITVTSATLAYHDTAILPGTLYYYYVVSVDSQSVTSNNSVTVNGQEGPSQPQNFQSVPGVNSITLTWNSVSTGDAAVSYTVYRTSSAGPVTDSLAAGGGAAQTFVDSNSLTQGINYSYYVAGVDAVTVTGADSITLLTALLPAAPAGVTAFSASQVNGTVNWTAAAVTNLTGYNLYRNTSPVTTGGVTVASNIPVSLAGNPVTTYTDLTSLTPGTIYYYLLQAVNPGGGGALSTAGFETPPAAPNLTAVSSASAITLSWTPSAGAVSYTVYENSAAPVSIGITNSTSFAVTSGLSPGVSYSFQLTAEDYGAGIIPGGASTMTAPVTWGLAPQPVSITSLSVSLTGPGSTAVTVNWTPVTEADATGVSLLFNTGPTTAGALGVSLSAATTTGWFNLGPDYIYNFWALVINPYGTSSSALPGAATLTYPSAVGLNPIGLAPDGVSRILSWSPLTGVSISQFIVYREETAPIASGWSPAVTLLGNVSLPVTLSMPIAPASSYNDEVVAVNATGAGPVTIIQPFSSLPAAPVSVTALSGLSTASSAVSLSWADPNAGTEGVTIYNIYRSPSNATTNAYVAVGAVTVAPSPTPPISFTDASVTATGVYYYIITADLNGEQTELYTGNAVSVRAYDEPNSPGFPTAVPSNNNVQLTWTAAVSTTYPVAGYDIYRSTSASVTSAALLNASPDPVTLYNDSTAVNLTTYYYWVSTVDTAGDSSTLIGPVSAEPLNAPSVPGNVSLANGDEAVQIAWKSSTAGTLPIGGYQLFRATALAGPYAPLTFLGPSATGYVDGVPPGAPLVNTTTYYYYVVAVDDSGVTTGADASADSVTVNGTPSAADINPPSSLTATGMVSQVKLSWTDSFVPFGQPVTGYQVYRSVGTPASFAPLTMLGSLSSPITDLAVSNGTAYYYYFVAYCQAGTTSANSVTVNATPARPPSIPVGLTGVDGNNSVTLSWTPNTPVDNVGVTQYVVYRNAAPTLTVNNAAATVDTGVSNGNTYTYQVEAVNANGVTGSLSSSITDYPYTMSAPTLNSGGGVASLAMTFTSPITTTYPVVSNDLERVPLGGSSPVTTYPAPGSSPVTDSTVTQGQLYVYTIQAVDNKGHLSPLSNAVTDAACNPPAAPSTVVVEPGTGQILLDWPPVTTPVGSLPVSFYLLTGPNGTVTVQASQSWYLDIPENGAGLVTYTLVGVDESGEITSNHAVTYSGVIAGTQNAALYNPPTGLTAVLSNGKVQLNWAQPNFGGRVVTSFNIYRGSTYGSYTKIGSENNPATAPVSTYTDSNVFANNTYFYWVTAVYGGTVESPYSNHALIVTAGGGNTPTVSVGQMAFNANLVKPLSGQTLGIYFVSPASGPVAIKVYTIAGTLIKTLNPPAATANNPENLTWDMTDRNGSVVASGIYFLEMDGPGGFHVIKKVAVVK